MTGPALFAAEEYATCGCGHPAVDHHGQDRSPRNGGCFATGSGFAWSPAPKCTCTKTAADVMGPAEREGAETDA